MAETTALASPVVAAGGPGAGSGDGPAGGAVVVGAVGAVAPLLASRPLHAAMASSDIAKAPAPHRLDILTPTGRGEVTKHGLVMGR